MSNQVSRTHDISFIEYHIENIEQLGADLNEAVQAAWPKRHSIRYSQVYVLLLSWEADDLEVHLEIEPLRRVLEDRYRFSVQEYKIPSLKPDKALKKRIYDFLEKEDGDTLLVVYYAGHARSALQSNEASLWCANRDDSYLVVPSGGIQSMLEEADADVILLCDCCHSTAIPTTDSQQRNNKVMEAITACGYETRAAHVGDHSFTNALTHELAVASKGLPFTISELHARVVSKLRCWAPGLLKGEDGNYVDTADNHLLFERQHRRTPIFTVVCRANPTRSIIIAPLGQIYPSPDSGEESATHASGKMPEANMDIDSEGIVPPQEEIGCKKRKRPVDDEGKCPFILISARLEKRYNKQAWVEWVRNAPDNAKDIHVEGAYDSFSTLLLIRMPTAVWNLLPSNLAYTFLGYVTSENYAIPKRCDCTGVDLCEICTAASAASITDESTGADTPDTNTPQNMEFDLVSVSRGPSQFGGEIGSMEDSPLPQHAQLDPIQSEVSTAPPVPLSVAERDGQRPKTGSASYTSLSSPSSSFASSSNEHNRRTPSATQDASSFRDLSLNNPPKLKPSASAGPSSWSRGNVHASSIGHDSSTMSTASSTRDLDNPTAAPFGFRGRPHHSHHSSRRPNRHKGNRPTDTEEWFWFCHQCGDGPLSTNIPACADTTCNHWRCGDCRMELHKLRGAA
ncbi:hypothetical protein N431DRAFT_417524 [Stipitochalara longipes BDJ]|nr:hypothetical protein N431DRAFT_417524 [Stipitochalara longipes BDJ]